MFVDQVVGSRWPLNLYMGYGERRRPVTAGPKRHRISSCTGEKNKYLQKNLRNYAKYDHRFLLLDNESLFHD